MGISVVLGMGFFDTLKALKKSGKKPKNTPVLICPGCRQPTLFRAPANWASPEFYRCKSCDYEGAFYLEFDPEETGEKFIDMKKLQGEFPEDRDPDTEII